MMKIKKIFSIIIITALCLGKINSQTTTPATLPLSGIQFFNHDYDALNSIQSTQTILDSVKTTYTAGSSIVLNPGFHAVAGSEFTAKIEDVSHRITIMTTNLHKRKHTEQAENISLINPDIVSVQEIKFPPINFTKMMNKSEYNGEYCATITIATPPTLPSPPFPPSPPSITDLFGIGILWKPSLTPPAIYKRTMPVLDSDGFRAYIIAVFPEYCVVATHYSTNESSRKNMTHLILTDPEVVKCKNLNKPVYIAGDMNAESGEDGVKDLENADFVVLNDSTSRIDLILEYNKNSNHKVISQGIAIPLPFITEDQWLDEDHGGISDHLPRYVRVKFK